MGRPFAIIGFSMFASLFFIGILGIYSAYILLAICMIAGIVMLSIPRLRKYTAVGIAAFSVVFACLLYVGYYYFSYHPVTKYFGKEFTVSGRVEDYPDFQYDKYYTEVKVEKVNQKSVKPFTMRISFAEPVEAEPGDTLQTKTYVLEAGSDSVFTKLNFLSKGIYALSFSSEEPVITKNTDSFKGINFYLATYRKAIVHSLMQLLPKNSAALAAAVLIGDKSYIGADVKESISSVGISHIICVSGLHLSILGFAFIKLFDMLKTSRKVKYLSCAVFILFFMALCGFTSSVVRAGVMFLIYILAELLLAEPDSRNSLGLASILILLNPFHAGNIGFIFSFTATLSIITAGSKGCAYLKEKWSIPKRKKLIQIGFSVLEIIIISLCVNVFCLPFSVMIFKKISLISIFANVLILPFASALLISSGLTAVFGMLPLGVFGFIVYPVAFICSTLCAYMLKIVHLLGIIPFSNIYTGTVPVFITMALTLLICAGCVVFINNKKKCFRVSTFCAVLLFLTGVGISFIQNTHTLALRVHSLKNNICISLTCADEFILLDAGNNTYTYQKVKESLFRSNSRDIDYFILSANARTQSGKSEKIIRECEVKNLVLPPKTDAALYQQLSASTRITQEQYQTFTTKHGITVTYYNIKFCAVSFSYNGTNVLYVNTPYVDLSVLPNSMQHFSYLIIGGKVNETFSNEKTNAIIEISGEKTNTRINPEQTIYTTDSLSDIEIRISNSHSTIGRANRWLQ